MNVKHRSHQDSNAIHVCADRDDDSVSGIGDIYSDLVFSQNSLPAIECPVQSTLTEWPLDVDDTRLDEVIDRCQEPSHTATQDYTDVCFSASYWVTPVVVFHAEVTGLSKNPLRQRLSVWREKMGIYAIVTWHRGMWAEWNWLVEKPQTYINISWPYIPFIYTCTFTNHLWELSSY